MKNKTIKQHLEELPEPHKTKAMKNLLHYMSRYKAQTQQMALQCAFVWETSDEGRQYWQNVYDTIKPKYPPIPAV